MKISGKVIDLHLRSIYGAVVTIGDGRILDITRRDDVPERFIMPGLIDAHVHIESSMATPGSFAVEAVRHGTVAVVTDPHEIANVMGIEGVRFMIEDARRVPLRFVFGAPSCVPATPVESSGARLDSTDVGALLKDPDIGFLSEMMNFPGVLGDDPEIMEKLKMARHYSKPVDGHAPGLTGGELEKYISAGISTDHECTSLEEAREKIKIGMKVLIREGSAARNLTALHALIDESPEMVMICSDDIHPDDLERGHIDQIFRKLLAWGHNLFDLIMVASVNPATHYRTGTGLLREGDSADFIVIDNLENFTVLSTFIAGREVFGDGVVKFGYERVSAV
ncbi:MAG: adenine deaminase, partial [Bacteroidetes bacterium]|nr:adenine deaminase [Bacteroidota bacterium]